MERKITSIWSVNYTQDLLKTDSSKDLLGMINLKFCKMNSNICKIIFELAILSKKKKEKKKGHHDTLTIQVGYSAGQHL